MKFPPSCVLVAQSATAPSSRQGFPRCRGAPCVQPKRSSLQPDPGGVRGLSRGQVPMCAAALT